MDGEDLLESVGKVLAGRDPELYERAKSTHRLLPFVCMQGYTGGSIIIDAVTPFFHPQKASGHDYTDETKLVHKSKTGVHLAAYCSLLHMALCVEKDEFPFLKQVVGFCETPLGLLMAIYACEARKRGDETWARFCYSLNLKGFLDVMNKQLDRASEDGRADFEGLCDPLLKMGSPIWTYFSLKTFSSGEPPTHSEMDEFCHRWVSEQRKEKRRVKVKENTPYKDILESGWIVEGLWCLDWQDIPDIIEDVDYRTPKPKIDIAETRDAHIDGFKKAAKRASLKSEYKHSSAMVKFTEAYRLARKK